jgi:hypothetical protein
MWLKVACGALSGHYSGRDKSGASMPRADIASQTARALPVDNVVLAAARSGKET